MSTERNSSITPMGKPEVLGPGLTLTPLHVPDQEKESSSSVLLIFDSASDPTDRSMACQLQEGFVGIYEMVGAEGHIAITVYTDKRPIENVLEKGVPFPLTSGDIFALSGTGKVKVTNVPPFEENRTYKYIPKPTYSH